MHKDIIKVSNKDIIKPTGEVHVLYYSSLSNNTHRFIEKLGFKHTRIPHDLNEKIFVDTDYVLITPTYSGGGEFKDGAVPKQVIQFLNYPENRKHCRGVMASGNTNFGDSFAVAGPILSKKLSVPLLFQFELLGTSEEITKIQTILNNFWKG